MDSLTTQVLIPAAQLEARVAQLGADISRDFKGRTLYIIGVLKGSFVFLADLMRHIDIDCHIEFIGVSSYEGMQSTGNVRISHDLSLDIQGKDVLLVEDIIDTATTIEFLLKTFEVRQPRSLKVAGLLSKPKSHRVKIDIDYVGFEIGPEFVIGYGLDYNGLYRNIPDLLQVLS